MTEKTSITKEIGWGMMAIIIGSVLGFLVDIVAIFLLVGVFVFLDLSLNISSPSQKLGLIINISSMFIPFSLTVAINYRFRKRVIFSVILGIISSTLIWVIGFAVLFGLSGGGLSL